MKNGKEKKCSQPCSLFLASPVDDFIAFVFDTDVYLMHPWPLLTNVCVCVCVCVCTQASSCMHMYTCVCVCVCKCTHKWLFVSDSVCKCVCTWFLFLLVHSFWEQWIFACFFLFFCMFCFFTLHNLFVWTTLELLVIFCACLHGFDGCKWQHQQAVKASKTK